MELFTVILFALALNMDSFGAGVAYGVRKIKLPLTSLLIISAMSMAAISISMFAGNVLAQVISASFAQRMGGIILAMIGLWILVQGLMEGRPKEDLSGTNEPSTVMQIRIRSMGLMIQVLREPHRADLDHSGVISSREALLLGCALAMDAFAAGFAVSMLGFSPLLTALVVGVGHFVLTYLGLLAGQGFGTTWIGRQLSALPGCILIALGLFKIH